MPPLFIFIYTLAFFMLLIGLLLSSSGSTGGIAALSGQDLELFKKTKDYGFIKLLKILMFLLIIVLIVLAIVIAKTYKQTP